MTIGTRIDKTSGPVATNNSSGLSVERDSLNAGFGPFKVDAVQAITSATTLTNGDAGVNTVSGSGAVTNVMPLASACPGAMFVFRNGSASAHALTGSQETAGTKVFVSQFSGSNGGSGSKLTLGAGVNQAVILFSDGVNFHVTSFSGSITINGT